MKKPLSLLLLSLVMITSTLFSVPLYAFADGETSGTCGDNATWEYNQSTHTLTISGTGAISDYSYGTFGPWTEFNAEIEKVIIGEGITDIGSYSFYKFIALNSISLPTTLKKIGNSAIEYCSALTSINIPNGVTRIGKDAFSSCENLSSIEMPSGLTTIDERAFSYCINLRNIEIPNNVSRIDDRAFYLCTNLNKIEIPNSVTYIGINVFDTCTSLTEINVGSENSYYSSVEGVLFNNNKSKLINYPIGKSATSYTIPDSVTDIGYDAFVGCTNLTSIKIPNTITIINKRAFEGCNKLVLIEYFGTKEQWNSYPEEFLNTYVIKNAVISCTDGYIYDESVYSVDGSAIYTADKSKLIKLLKTNEEKEFEIPDGVETISAGTFENTGVEVITCLDTVNKIEKDALVGENVRVVNLSDNITEIDKEAINNNTLAVVYENTATKETLESNNFNNIVSIEIESDNVRNSTRTASLQTTTGKRYAYTGSDIRPAVIIRHNGKVISNNSSDNDKNFAKKYTNNKFAGKATIIIAGKNEYAGLGRNINFHIFYNPSDYNVSLSKARYTYNGKVNKPSVTVKTPKGEKASNYSVYYDEAKSVGTHSVKVVFTDNKDGGNNAHSSGTIIRTYTINPDKPSLKKIKKAKGAVNLSWKKATQATTYQIQFSNYKNFKKAKSLTVSAKKNTKKINKLKTKKKYYFRIRAIKTVNGRQYYSDWGKTKSVKIK